MLRRYIKMFDLEAFVVDLLKTIKCCRDSNADEYKLILKKKQIKIIADAYDKVNWIEIY